MTVTCRICGQPIETPDTPRSEHAHCREQPVPAADDEAGYLSDLRGLIALTSAGVEAASPPQADVRDTPLSTEEATRLAEALVPAPPLARRRRLRVAALPLLALAAAGVVVQVSQLAVRPPSPQPPAITDAPPPALVEAVAAPLATTSGTAVQPEPEPDRTPEPSAHVTTPEAVVEPRPPRPEPAATSRSHTADVRASTLTPAPVVSAAPQPTSLMQAITNAVRSRPSATDHR